MIFLLIACAVKGYDTADTGDCNPYVNPDYLVMDFVDMVEVEYPDCAEYLSAVCVGPFSVHSGAPGTLIVRRDTDNDENGSCVVSFDVGNVTVGIEQ